MKFSIIIPMYNAVSYIIDCIKSIQNQSFNDFECIIIDDGSTDSSVSVCKNIIEADSRFKIFQQVHSCPANARNYGIDNANGDYILFIDSDDLLAADALKKISSFSEQHNNLSMILFDTQNVRLNGAALNFFHECQYLQRRINYGIASGQEMLCSMLEHHNIVSNIFLYAIERNSIKYKFPSIPLDEDTLYTIKNTAIASKVGHLQEKIYIKRTRGRSVLNSRMCFEKTISLVDVILDLAQWMENGADGILNDKLLKGMTAFLDASSKEVKHRWNRLSNSEKEKASLLPFYKQTIFKRFVQ